MEIKRRKCVNGFEDGCFICGSCSALQVHHIDWNHENDVLLNRIILCDRCHGIVHKSGFLSLTRLWSVRDRVRERRGLEKTNIQILGEVDTSDKM